MSDLRKISEHEKGVRAMEEIAQTITPAQLKIIYKAASYQINGIARALTAEQQQLVDWSDFENGLTALHRALVILGEYPRRG